MMAQPGMSRVGRGGWLVGLFAWCWAASGDAQAARTVVWLSAPSIERDPVAEAQRIHRERALRLELQARDLLLLEAGAAAAPEPDVPGTLASVEQLASQLLERSGAAAVLWLEGDDANAVSWLLVKSRGASTPAKTPLPYPPEAIESQLFALAAASLLDQVLSTAEAAPQASAEPVAPNPFVASPAEAAAAVPPPAMIRAPYPAAAPALAPPRSRIEPLPERFFFVNIGVAAAFAEIHHGMEASTTPSFNEVFSQIPSADGTTSTYYIDGSPYVPDADTVDDFGAISMRCDADGIATGPGEPASKYCARVDEPGLVAVPALRFAFGTWLRHDVSVAAFYQLHFTSPADRPFGNQSVGAEVQYLVVGERSQGFGASLVGGAFIGRYETATASAGGSYVNALSGPLGVTAGLAVRHAFHSQLAFVLAQHFGLRFPDVQAELALVGMSEVSF